MAGKQSDAKGYLREENVLSGFIFAVYRSRPNVGIPCLRHPPKVFIRSWERLNAQLSDSLTHRNVIAQLFQLLPVCSPFAILSSEGIRLNLCSPNEDFHLLHTLAQRD